MQPPFPFDFPIFTSAARTATHSSGPYVNTKGWRGVRIYIDVTDDPASASVVFSIEVKDFLSGDWKTILDSAAVADVTNGPTILDVYPGSAAVSNTVADRHIGKQFRVTATHSDSDSLTYSVGATWLP